MKLYRKSQDGYAKIRQSFLDIQDTCRIGQNMAKHYYDDIAEMLDGIESEVLEEVVKIICSDYRGFTMPKRSEWESYIKNAVTAVKSASNESQRTHNGVVLNVPYYYNEPKLSELEKERALEELAEIKKRQKMFIKKSEVVG